MDNKDIKVCYECDCRACEHCNYMQCNATSNIEHAINFVKMGDAYVEKSSLMDTDDNGYTHHIHCCEIELLHKNHKEYWKKHCPRGKKPNKKFGVGCEDICCNCNHSITIDFFNDKDSYDVRIRSIHRTDDLPKDTKWMFRVDNENNE